MDRLTITESVEIVKTHYKSDDFIAVTFCALRADYGRHHCPSKRTVGKAEEIFRSWICSISWPTENIRA